MLVSQCLFCETLFAVCPFSCIFCQLIVYHFLEISELSIILHRLLFFSAV